LCPTTLATSGDDCPPSGNITSARTSHRSSRRSSMRRAELLTAQHLARKAVISMRPWSPHQVLTHQESLRRQYAPQHRALHRGWRPEELASIDADLGLSATAAQHREGFKEVLTKVTLGEVGLILSSEVTRLSRNCSDWYPRLDICGYRSCLMADRD